VKVERARAIASSRRGNRKEEKRKGEQRARATTTFILHNMNPMERGGGGIEACDVDYHQLIFRRLIEKRKALTSSAKKKIKKGTTKALSSTG